MIFEVANEGVEEVDISRARLVLASDRQDVFADELEGERTIPTTLERGGSLRLWTRAKALASKLDEAGHGGAPRLAFVVEDGAGRSHEKSFRFRAGEYLDLRDE